MSDVSEAPVEIKPRTRQVWTKTEVKLVARAVKFMASKAVAAPLKCRLCKTDILTTPNADGYDLLCDCTRRVLNRGV